LSFVNSLRLGRLPLGVIGSPFFIISYTLAHIHTPIVMSYLLGSFIYVLIRLLPLALAQLGGSNASDVPPYATAASGALNGELKKWHKVTLGFVGPETSETNNVTNPFTDYRLDVTFTHGPTRKSYTVPGYYACDGNAANSGASAGSVWLVHFAPSEVGVWAWEALFLQGVNVSLADNPEQEGTSASYFDKANGSFEVESTDKTGRDHRGKGLLQYVERHHLRYAETGEWFLKAGPDSPENFLEFVGFDNTYNTTGNLKTWEPHIQDFNVYGGDPTWSGGKGKGIIGAINYLSRKGMRSISFLTFNWPNGDSPGVFPHASKDLTDSKVDIHRLRMDCSKLAQWEVVFEHADRMGIFLHFKTQVSDQLTLDLEICIQPSFPSLSFPCLNFPGDRK